MIAPQLASNQYVLQQVDTLQCIQPTHPDPGAAKYQGQQEGSAISHPVSRVPTEC